MIGQMQMLDQRAVIAHWKAKGLDFSKLFTKPMAPEGVAIYQQRASRITSSTAFSTAR